MACVDPRAIFGAVKLFPALLQWQVGTRLAQLASHLNTATNVGRLLMLWAFRVTFGCNTLSPESRDRVCALSSKIIYTKVV